VHGPCIASARGSHALLEFAGVVLSLSVSERSVTHHHFKQTLFHLMEEGEVEGRENRGYPATRWRAPRRLLTSKISRRMELRLALIASDLRFSREWPVLAATIRSFSAVSTLQEKAARVQTVSRGRASEQVHRGYVHARGEHVQALCHGVDYRRRQGRSVSSRRTTRRRSYTRPFFSWSVLSSAKIEHDVW
jgi:hypothetical protein